MNTDAIANIWKHGSELTEDERKAAVAMWKTLHFGVAGGAPARAFAAGLQRLRATEVPLIPAASPRYQYFDSDAYAVRVDKIESRRTLHRQFADVFFEGYRMHSFRLDDPELASVTVLPLLDTFGVGAVFQRTIAGMSDSEQIPVMFDFLKLAFDRTVDVSVTRKHRRSDPLGDLVRLVLFAPHRSPP